MNYKFWAVRGLNEKYMLRASVSQWQGASAVFSTLYFNNISFGMIDDAFKYGERFLSEQSSRSF